MDETDIEQEQRREVLRAWVKANGGHAVVVERRRLTPGQASYLSQVVNGYSFGSRAARNMETRLGMPSKWLDAAQTRTARPVHLVSQSQAQPPLFEWDELMSLKNLPAVFRVALKDASMAPDLLPGDELTIDTRMQAQPGDLVLARDDGGALYVGLYRVRRAGGPWALVPTNDAFEPLESARDGLTVVGVAVQEIRNRRRV